MNTVKLSTVILNHINGSIQEFANGQSIIGSIRLEVVKQLILDNKDTSVEVTAQYLNNVWDKVLNNN